jgi:hypothetical protein
MWSEDDARGGYRSLSNTWELLGHIGQPSVQLCGECGTRGGVPRTGVVCSAGRHGGRETGNPDESDDMRWTEEDGCRHGRKEGRQGGLEGERK